MTDWHWFVLDVNPEPWAIGPLGVGRKNGKIYPYVGRNDQLYHFQQAVKEEVGNVDLFLEGKMEIRFYFWRRRDEYKTPQARGHRKHEADVTNLQKATEDALQGVLFKNDKDTNDIRSVMVEQGPDVKGRIVVAIRKNTDTPNAMAELPQDVCELLDSMDEESDHNYWDDEHF